MPLVRITVRDDTDPATRQAVADGVQRAMVAAIGIPENDRFQIIDQLPASAVVADPTYLGVERRNPVIIQITLVRGRSQEKKAALFRAIADELVAAGVRAEDVMVVLTETGRDDWSLGNGEAQLLDTALLARHGWRPPAE